MLLPGANSTRFCRYWIVPSVRLTLFRILPSLWNLSAISIEFIVHPYFLSPVVRPSHLIFCSHLLQSLYLPLLILRLCMVYRVYFCSGWCGPFVICNLGSWQIDANCNLHTLAECCRPFWEIVCQFPKCYISPTFVYSLCRKHGFCQLVCLYACNGHTPPWGPIIVPIDSDSIGMVSCFSTWIVACTCAPSSDALCDSMIHILDRSLFLPKILIGGECKENILLSNESIPLTQRSMYVVLSEMSAA